MPILPEQTDIAGGDKRLNLHRLAGRGPDGEPGGGGPAGGGGRNGRDFPDCSSVANPDHPGKPNPIVLVAKCQAVTAWHFATTFKRYSAEKRSESATLPQPGKSRPFREAQRKENQRKETRQKKGAARRRPLQTRWIVRVACGYSSAGSSSTSSSTDSSASTGSEPGRTQPSWMDS